jgi:coenzyme F420-reducing hydrogenase beta subunit
MIKIEDKAMCCGCGSCAKVCPKGAITMEADKCGSKYPKIDADKCVDCGICDKHCPVLHYSKGEDMSHAVYAAYANDPETRYEGSSGGMFGLLAKSVIARGGAVYGAAFDRDLKLRCTRACTEEELKPLYKSKYLQSELTPAFDSIKSDLENGLPVLFVSTPCQVFALKLFLKKEYENLLLVDFLCHGVPSQELFDQCKAYDEKKQKCTITDFQFRAKKKNGSTPHYFKIKYRRGEKEYVQTKLYVKSSFYYGFQKYITLRDSCYSCRFAYSNRCSDVTIGDFHTINKYVQGINRFDGVSTVCINTEKGRAAWQGIQDKTVCSSVDFKQIYDAGELMHGGTQKPPRRDDFVHAMETEPFDDVADKYLDGSGEYAKQIYYGMPAPVRKIMRKLLRIE